MISRALMFLGGSAWLASSWLASSVLAANPARFVARFANGAFVEGNTLSDWHAPEAIPKLDAQSLFDPVNPVRWLVDRSLSPPQLTPEAFVEMTTGDRLPGVVVDFRPGDDSPYSPLPSHFIVRYEGPNFATLEPQSTLLRINANYVRRVVWNRRRNDQWQPRTAFLRDGSFLRFRSIRWSAGAVSLLLDSGPRRLSLNELAEVDLAPGQFWPTYFDELAMLSPDGQRRLLQADTTSGLIVTTSLERQLPRVVGDAKDLNRWVLGVQPAWSLDIVWLGQGTVWARRSFAPHEVPLSRVPPVRVDQRSALGSATFPFATNRNLQSGPLRSATREAGWGFGVQAFCELEFELPPIARTLRSEFAIDASMKTGGCVQARILNASAGNNALYQGPILVGSESLLDTGALGISGSGDSLRRIVLQVDPVLVNRPLNADPFNIRDQANWIDPVVELDPNAVKLQIDSRLYRHNLAWDGWEWLVEPGGQVQRTSFFAEAPANSGEYRTAVSVSGGAIKLTKNYSLSTDDQWLVVDAVRTQPPGPPCKLSVKIGDAMPVEWDVPLYDKARSDFRPLILSLAEPRRKNIPSIAIELRQLPTPDRVPVLWRAISFVGQHPMFYRLLEDSTPVLASPSTAAPMRPVGEFDDRQKFTGTHSLRLPIAAEYELRLNRPLAIRERPQLGEYRFLQFAVRKQGGGGVQVSVQHLAAAERPTSYEAGVNPPADPTVKRLSNQALPNDWQVFTRDLFGDFGNLELTGITFQFPDGEHAWLDHVYLARTQSDYELIKATLPQGK